MKHLDFKKILYRAINNCIAISTFLALAILITTVFAGLRVQLSDFPGPLGNSGDNIRHLKSTADPDGFTFLVVGDIKGSKTKYEALRDVIHAYKPAFAVVFGDFVHQNNLLSHKFFALEITGYTKELPLIVIPGNHDTSNNSPIDLKDFENIYGPAQFSFTLGQSLFIFLNTISPYGDTGQYLKYLEKAITSQTMEMENIFVFVPIPPPDMNSSLMGNSLLDNEQFLQLTKKYHINYVFSNGFHKQVKNERDGTAFMVTGDCETSLNDKYGKLNDFIKISLNNGVIDEAVFTAKSRMEITRQKDHERFIFLWSLISRNFLSVTITVIVFGLTTWLLITSIQRKLKLLKKI